MELKRNTEALWNGMKMEFGKVYANPYATAFRPMHEAELPTGKKLRVFDFDDTIIKTDSYIYIKHSNGKKSKLTPGQYAKYTPKSGDELDFSDFHAINNPKPIKKYFDLLKKLYYLLLKTNLQTLSNYS